MTAEESLSYIFHFIHLFYSHFILLKQEIEASKARSSFIGSMPSRIYFQQYFILPVFPTISGILPPPIFMKLYILLPYEKAAA